MQFNLLIAVLIVAALTAGAAIAIIIEHSKVRSRSLSRPQLLSNRSNSR
jgi:hypothetical protein